MATATVTRPTQALRHRRDAPRPSLSKRQATMEGAGGVVVEPASKKRKLAEPYVRDSQYILTKHQGKAPSLVVHLYDTTFRFEGQDISWTYDSPMSCVIRHLKKQTVPHEMMEELLSPAIQWYDGCLIVEIQNHRAKAGKETSRQDSAANDGNGNIKFGMHNYTPHITPSPMVPFPSKAINDDALENGPGSSNNNTGADEMPAPERPKDKDGPTIATIVLHPTQLSQHHEMLILMKTSADQVRSKKRGSDSATPSAAQPPTPQLSVPPTPLTQTSRGPLTQSQKMCLEEGDLYTFQSDLLIATEPPLFLDSVDNPQDADRVLEMLQHPLHQAKPPSSKTRKRTTAEVAADDAQAAETERRMLIMDERIKPAGAGAGANENQSAAASLGFSRFKTIEMVRQKHEEADRVKKEEEARAAMEKKQQQEEQSAAHARQKQEQLLAQQASQQHQQHNQQNLNMLQAEQLRQARAQQARQQAMLNAQSHGHPQPNGMLPNGQQAFQQANQQAMSQSSPVARQQTPMVNSSPMLPQSGFPMAQTSSQGAGSPPRPTSGALPNSMARQTSQQHPGSRNNTPQIPQGTPGLVQAMPSRQTTQTPRMQPSSPAAAMQQGTPTSMSMTMQTPQMGHQMQYTPEQMQMLSQRQQGMAAGQPNGQLHGASQMPHMTPEQVQAMRAVTQQHHQQHQQQVAMLRQAHAAGNQQMVTNIQLDIQRRQQHLKISQQRILQQGQAQQQQQQQLAQMAGANAGQAGSPGSIQQATPQIAHAHPQQAAQQQQQQQQAAGGNMQDANQLQNIANAQQKAAQLAAMRQNAQLQQAQQQLQNLGQQYGGLINIPQQVLNQLPAVAQQMLRQQLARQQQVRQQQSMRAQAAQQQAQLGGGGGGGGGGGAGGGAGEQVPGSQPNPQYMAQLRNNQAMLAQMQNQQAGNMNTMGMQSFTMNGMGNAGFAGSPGPGGMQGGNDLSQQFAAMANALNQPNPRQGAGGMQ